MIQITHGGQSLDACATQQSQQQGLGLVITMMGSNHAGAITAGVSKQGLIAGLGAAAVVISMMLILLRRR